MLTSAEELGLSGSHLAGQVQRALARIPESVLLGLMRRVREEASRRHLVYLRDGAVETIHVLPCPLTVLPEQLAYLHATALTLLNALKRLPELCRQDAAVRDLLRLLPEEEAWIWDCWGPSHREHNPVFGRLDAVVDLTSPMWKNSLHFLEPNLTGIGGLHLVPTCEHIIADVVLPALRVCDSELHLELCPDIRELLIREVFDHAKAIRRPIRNLCFVEPKYAGSGPDEQEALAAYFRTRHGLHTWHADPAELTCCGDEVCYHGEPIDLVYRDYPVYDLLELERQGVHVEPMRRLFRQNRIISSVTAEFDLKSCWEVLTDAQLTHKYFGADERLVFRRHVLWTRLLGDRSTVLPDGQAGGLLEYVRKSQEFLVLKPNRAFGGEGVVLGPSVARAEWEAAVERALADRERWVVQQLASIPAHDFPVAGPDGRLHSEPFYMVVGFTPTSYGVAVVGRASQKQVVNVAQRGGMFAILTGRPPGRLVGPGWRPPAKHA